MDRMIPLYLSKSMLFRGFSPDDVEKAISKSDYRLKKYSKGELIVIEGHECSSIGIVMSGEVVVQKVYFSGKVVNLTKLSRGDVFGEVIVFSNHREYPATILSQKSSTVLFISRENIITLCKQDERFLENFMMQLSNKILMLNRKVENLSLKTIRQKICRLLIEEYKRQKALKLKIATSRKDMAENFGIPRPSLSRELINMRDEGLIDFGKGYIEVMDIEAIEDFLF